MRNSISWLSVAKLWLAVNGAGERRTFYTHDGAQWWLDLWNNRAII